MNLSHNLKNVLDDRRRAGLPVPTYEELARIANCSKTTINSMANNETRSFNLDIIGRLAEALEVNPEDFIAVKTTQ